MARTRNAAALTPARLARLYRLVHALARGPVSRATLLKRLRLDVRGFYRDLETIRRLGVPLGLEDGRYRLLEAFAHTARRLPFPDPGLNLHEATLLAKGASAAHRKLRDQIKQLTA